MVKDVSNLRAVDSSAEAAISLYRGEIACIVDVLGAVYAGGGRLGDFEVILCLIYGSKIATWKTTRKGWKDLLGPL